MIDSVATKVNLRKGLTISNANSRQATRNTIKESMQSKRHHNMPINKDLQQVDEANTIKAQGSAVRGTLQGDKSYSKRRIEKHNTTTVNLNQHEAVSSQGERSTLTPNS